MSLEAIDEMHVLTRTDDVSIRYTLALDDGMPLSPNVGEDRLDDTRGQEQLIPFLKEALHGTASGERKQIVLLPKCDPRLKLDSTRLALPPDHAGEALVLTVEIL